MLKNGLLLSLALLASLVTSIAFSSETYIGLTPDEVTRTKAAYEELNTWQGNRKILASAKMKLDTLVGQNPDNYYAILQLARYYLMAGFKHIVKESNGKYLYDRSNYKPFALEFADYLIKHALRINPNYADAYVLQGYLYTQTNELVFAKAALRKARRIGTDNPWLTLNTAEVHFIEGNREKAIELYKKGLELSHDNKKAYTAAESALLANYIYIGNFDAADALYQKMLQSEPDNAWLRGNYSDFLRERLGQFDQSVYYAREALSIMNYGVGRRILAYSLYALWAEQTLKGADPIELQKLFSEAQSLHPDLHSLMAFQGAFAANTPLVKVLLKKGVSIDARTKDGSTALMIAANTGRVDAMQLLLDAGADINAASTSGLTALLGASLNGADDAVKLLLDNGADTDIKVNTLDAAGWARVRGRDDIAEMIESAREDRNS